MATVGPIRADHLRVGSRVASPAGATLIVRPPVSTEFCRFQGLLCSGYGKANDFFYPPAITNYAAAMTFLQVLALSVLMLQNGSAYASQPAQSETISVVPNDNPFPCPGCTIGKANPDKLSVK